MQSPTVIIPVFDTLTELDLRVLSYNCQHLKKCKIEHIIIAQQNSNNAAGIKIDGLLISHTIGRHISKKIDIQHLVQITCDKIETSHILIVPLDLLIADNKYQWIDSDIIQPYCYLNNLDQKQTLEILNNKTITGDIKRTDGFGLSTIIRTVTAPQSFEKFMLGTGQEMKEMCYRLANQHQCLVFGGHGQRLYSDHQQKIEKLTDKKTGEIIADFYKHRPRLKSLNQSPKRQTTQKVSRQKLIPMINANSDQSLDAELEFICKHRKSLGKFIVVLQENPTVIEKVLKETGMQIIPTITTHRLEKHYFPTKDIRSKKAPYIKWLIQNANKLPYIIAGNAGSEIDDNTLHWQTMRKILPEIQNKMIFAIFDDCIEAEARRYAKGDKRTPIRNLSIRTRHPVISFCGHWVAYQDAFEMYENEQIPRIELMFENIGYGHTVPRQNIINPSKERTYPFDYFRNYLKSGVRIWSGVGHESGARRNNLSILIEAGYEACLFFVPDKKEKYRSAEQSYFCDIR